MTSLQITVDLPTIADQNASITQVSRCSNGATIDLGNWHFVSFQDNSERSDKEADKRKKRRQMKKEKSTVCK